MADVIHMDYLLLPIINRFGIQLGFGDKSVEQVCNDHQINLPFFLDILNTYHDADYMPTEKMQKYPVKIIIDYLEKTHLYYKDTILPEIKEKIDSLSSSCKTNCENLDLIEDFYNKYRNELIFHLKNEEEKFFPYVNALEANKDSSQDIQTLREKYNFSYDAHSEEHENVLIKLLDLKNILIKYLPPNYDQHVGNDLLFSLFVFEKDIKDHERLEDVILLPALKRIERTFDNKIQ
jgi:regulator of cell morphogenesis and NO signaling